MRSLNIAVIGASIAGTATAYFLKRNGHNVTVYEREEVPIFDCVQTAWKNGERKRAMHAMHSHSLLPGLVNVFKNHAPEFLDRLEKAGAKTVEFKDYAKKFFPHLKRDPGDQDMSLLKCRRIILENESRKLLRDSGVKIERDVQVNGLVTVADSQDNIPTVAGIYATCRGEKKTIYADLVIDASGRNTRQQQWLADFGVKDVLSIKEDSGIFYTTRWFRLKDQPRDMDMLAINEQQILGAPYFESSYLHGVLVLADNGYYSVSLIGLKSDDKLRQITREENWSRVVAALPGYAQWIDEANAEPVSEVYSFGHMNSTYRPVMEKNNLLVNNFVNVGDALCTLNPSLGQGCAMAWVGAFELARCLTDEETYYQAIKNYYDYVERNFIPTVKFLSRADKLNILNAELIRKGDNPFDFRNKDGTVDTGRYFSAVMNFGLKYAMTNDMELYRKIMRFRFMLSGPEIMGDKDVIDRAKQGLEEYLNRGGILSMTPGWEELCCLIE